MIRFRCDTNETHFPPCLSLAVCWCTVFNWWYIRVWGNLSPYKSDVIQWTHSSAKLHNLLSSSESKYHSVFKWFPIAFYRERFAKFQWLNMADILNFCTPYPLPWYSLFVWSQGSVDCSHSNVQAVVATNSNIWSRRRRGLNSRSKIFKYSQILIKFTIGL